MDGRARRRAVVHAPREDEDEAPLVDISTKRYWAGVGPMLLGCWWAARPGEVQVSPFYFLFSVFYFLFYILLIEILFRI
jgi:hypothetical protein